MRKQACFGWVKYKSAKKQSSLASQRKAHICFDFSKSYPVRPLKGVSRSLYPVVHLYPRFHVPAALKSKPVKKSLKSNQFQYCLELFKTKYGKKKLVL